MSSILIVDDSGMARRVMRQSLEEMGHTVEEAIDGNQALERYFINRHDLILLDIVMEGMYGLDVLRKFRDLDPAVRVIIATADIQSSTREEAQATGAAGLINKPYNRERLNTVVSTVLAGGMAWS